MQRPRRLGRSWEAFHNVPQTIYVLHHIYLHAKVQLYKDYYSTQIANFWIYVSKSILRKIIKIIINAQAISKYSFKFLYWSSLVHGNTVPIFSNTFCIFACNLLWYQFICGRRLPLQHRFRWQGDAAMFDGQLVDVYENTKVVDWGQPRLPGSTHWIEYECWRVANLTSTRRRINQRSAVLPRGQ
jgi:hypothetical protein